MNERLFKHLEFVQSVINRMASNSFLIKGWVITLVAALFALSAKDSDITYILISYLPVPAFWILDGYYLWQERLFRALYNDIRIKDESQIDFSMNTKEFIKGKNTWLWSIFSVTLNVFYISLIITMIIVMCILYIKKGGG